MRVNADHRNEHDQMVIPFYVSIKQQTIKRANNNKSIFRICVREPVQAKERIRNWDRFLRTANPI